MLLYATSSQGRLPVWVDASGETWYSLISPDNNWSRSSSAGMDGRDDDYLTLLFCSEDQTLRKLKNSNLPAGKTAFNVLQTEHLFSHGYNWLGLATYDPLFRFSPTSPLGGYRGGRLSQISNTSETILLGDSFYSNRLFATYHASLIPSDAGYAKIDPTMDNQAYLYPRHSKGMSTVFSCADGRVVTLRAGAPHDSTRIYSLPQFGGIGFGASSEQYQRPPSDSWWDRN